MGRIFQLLGMVDPRTVDEDIAKLSPVQRHNEIEKVCNGSKLVGLYSPSEFAVSFAGEIVTIKEGWHQYAPQFAVWALGKYGKGSRYGKTYRSAADGKLIENPELLDEAPAADRKVRGKEGAE